MKGANDFTVCVARTHEKFLNLDNKMFKTYAEMCGTFLSCVHIYTDTDTIMRNT